MGDIHPRFRTPHRVWGYPWVPGVFVVASAAIVVNRLLSDPVDSVVGLGIVALGIPVYCLSRQREAAAMRELV